MWQGTAMREQLVDHYDGIKFAPSKHGVKGTYGSTKLATRATPEPVPTPVRVGGLIANAGTGAERSYEPVESRPPRVTGNAVAGQGPQPITEPNI